MSTQTNITTGQVVAGATAAFTANLRKLDGTSFTPYDISAIAVTVYDLGQFNGAKASKVEGYDNKTLAVRSVMFQPTEKTYAGKTYTRNFEWIPPVDESPFKSAGHFYKVIITFTVASNLNDICSPLVFQVKAI
ncbi:MAG: hypothetical protein IJF84_13275 [Thermoguttaceae bacterium]|nr:hypothetical protein [Thermoguttaceae bacterium]